jgi:hypothetical protein
MTAANRQHGNAHGHERFQGASGLAIGAVLARITCLCLGVNRPAIGAPARCTTALTPSSRPGSGFSEFQRRSLGAWVPGGPAGSQYAGRGHRGQLAGPGRPHIRLPR